ncbi:MAG: RNA-binding cell elongation regulator Jag/EloR [Tumebacillaceae bacterium]
MKKVITTGKTVELATELALQKLGVSRDRVTISVLTQPSRGLFGLIGARDAEVEVEVIPLDPIQETRTFIDDVLRSMNLHDVTVDVVENGDNTYTFRLSGESIGILIGRRGATLDSFQYLVNLVANKNSDSFLRVQVDAEDYRNRRKETLERLAERLANKSLQSKREVQLEPMSSAERKIIHSYLQGRTDVVTFSMGDEPYRKVVIAPKEKGQSGNKPRGPRRKETKTKQQS